ncbi:MAG: sodium:solute symporter [Planctomycetes bacterium GWF2_42_9]|nr:MAG: sodium:solute symporter [Planctomycetes bacterium GWF2_42_9]
MHTDILANTVGVGSILAVVVYLLVIVYLGWLGYQGTKSATDYLVAGRKAHPVIMALSYGATFISTSAIVGFGGAAGLFGFSVLWLTFLNIFIGIFIAFVFIGGPARRMGHALDAHTFPELLGRRFDSKFIQVFAGVLIFIFMPLYSAAVLIGGAEFISTQLGIGYDVALLVFSVITAAYVIMGGLKGVMYTDALQGAIMFVGMGILLVWSYIKVGGVTEGHQALTDMVSLVPGKLREIGHQGWTAMPLFGFGEKKYDLWWTVISTITMGVGIGVLAQPQLVVRFMTVKSKRELNRAVPVGGVFILMMTGVAFIVGALSNVYFNKYGADISGRVIKVLDGQKKTAVMQIMKQNEAGMWSDVEGKLAPVRLTGEAAGLTTIENKDIEVLKGKSISVVYAGSNVGQIIPLYVTSAMPKWFGIIFLLTLLSAAMSTLSSQFHTMGTGIGRDIYEQLNPKHTGKTMSITRCGVILGIVIAVVLSYFARQSPIIIARATAIFFGLCASTFLPALLGALFFKRMTKAAAITSMIIGFLTTAFWLVFVKAQEAGDIGIVQKFTNGQTSILADYPNWPVVDPLVVALPISILAAIIVAFVTKTPKKECIDKCFQ